MQTRNPHLERARLLLGQDRRDLAEKELRQAIAIDPNSAEAFALLALCMVDSERALEAKVHALRAVGLEPDNAFNHYVVARVMLALNSAEKARGAINEALRFQPMEPQYWALLAQLELNLKNHRAALQAAESGLVFDAEHEGCINLRAIALTNLGDRAEATKAIESTLRRNPLSASSHANMGWTLLHEGEPRRAMEHFREALKLEPGSEWARQGIVEAMKARNPVYRVFLAYFLFMSRLQSRVQWIVIVGGYLGMQGLRQLAAANPSIAPYVGPVIAAYVVFALGTVVAVPLFNLLLFTSRFGRYALYTAQRWGALVFGVFLIPPVTSLVLWAVTGDVLWEVLALITGLLCLPVALAGVVRSATTRWVMIGWSGVMLLAAAALIAALLLNMNGSVDAMGWYVIGCMGSVWIANIAGSLRPRARG